MIVSLALILASLTLLSTSVASLDSTDWGLVSKLPVIFWIGLLSLIPITYYSRNSQFRMFILFMLIFLYMYIIPTVIEVYPALEPSSYYPSGEASLLASTGHWDSDPSIPLISYREWPGFIFFGSELKLLTNLSDASLYKFFPLITIFIYCIITFAILRLELNPAGSFLGIVWLLLSFFYSQYYFSPQGFSFILYLTVILLSFKLFLQDKIKQNGAMKILIVFIFAVLVYSHSLTPFLIIFLIFTIAFFSYLFVKREDKNLWFRYCIKLFFIWVAYSLYIAKDFFGISISDVYEVILGAHKLSVYNEAVRISPSLQQTLTISSAWAIVILNGLILFYASISLILKKEVRVLKKSIWVISMIPLAAFAFGVEYGAESYQRAFIFGLVSFSFLCASALSNKPKILFSVLSIAIILHIPAHYGATSYKVASDTELDGVKFFANAAPNSSSYSYVFTSYVYYSAPRKTLDDHDLGRPPFTKMPDVNALKQTNFFLDSAMQSNYYLYYVQQDPLTLIRSSDHANKIYDNTRFRLYWSNL